MPVFWTMSAYVRRWRWTEFRIRLDLQDVRQACFHLQRCTNNLTSYARAYTRTKPEHLSLSTLRIAETPGRDMELSRQTLASLPLFVMAAKCGTAIFRFVGGWQAPPVFCEQEQQRSLKTNAQPARQRGCSQGFGYGPNKQKLRFPATRNRSFEAFVGTKALLAHYYQHLINEG